MLNYLHSEILKTKSSGLIVQILLFLLVAIVTAAGFSLTSIDDSAILTLFNWMSFLLINLLIPIIVHSIYQHEKKSTAFQNLLIPKNNQHFEWISKIIVSALYYLAFLSVFLVTSLLLNLIDPYSTSKAIVLSVAFLFITAIWQIPFVFLIERSSNFLITLTLNFALGTLLTIFLGDTGIYRFIPWSWSARALMTTLRININGSSISLNDPLVSQTSVLYLLAASIVLLIVLSGLLIKGKDVSHEKNYSASKSRKVFSKA